MTQFILPSASISVTMVIPLKVFVTYISLWVCIPPKLCREVKGDFSLQLGETWQAHRHRSSCNGVRLLLFIYFNWRLITVLWWLWSLLRMVNNPPIMWETWVRSLG